MIILRRVYLVLLVSFLVSFASKTESHLLSIPIVTYLLR